MAGNGRITASNGQKNGTAKQRARTAKKQGALDRKWRGTAKLPMRMDRKNGTAK
ncbi:hypothetical protein [Bacillus sp. SJS]|uniref:hypothetical protein n=1 Tax=Bacillus sp. SJS TaxID=1423321 RepID=UPI000A4B72B0|nr:hypothetical protein [Bacillus sp. SJS]